MSLRIAILYCCMSGALIAQEPAPDAPPPSGAQPAAGQASPEEKPPTPVQPTNHPRRPAAAAHPAPAEPPPLPSPAQMLLDALGAAIRQASANGQSADLAALAARRDQLQNSLNAKADPAEISRQATELLVALYAPAKPSPPAPDPPRIPLWRRNDLLFIAILVSLMSPLICVAGFWWGNKTAENSLRKRLREAGLL